VCTFKRPTLLKPLLHELERQRQDGTFTFSMHIVDNDAMKTAEGVVEEIRRRSRVPMTYDVEPVQNIALARNRAVSASRGNFIAFMDDDENPCEDWLIRLHATCREYRADGALGPVKPYYTPDTPSWLRKSGLCERPSHLTGTILNGYQTRTGNV
jgi:succinoglycan biosynthesis protein ExoM